MKCPECKKNVRFEENPRDTEGQESEHLAGFRICSNCKCYVKIY